MNQAGPAASASYSLIGGIILLGGMGYAVDRWLGSAPWGVFVGLALGIVVGFYELMNAAQAADEAGRRGWWRPARQPGVLGDWLTLRRDRANPEALWGIAGPLASAAATWVVVWPGAMRRRRNASPG